MTSSSSSTSMHSRLRHERPSYGRSSSTPITITSSSSSNSTARRVVDREQLLARVESILLHQPPSRAALLELLQLCQPQLTLPDLNNAVTREKAVRSVKAKLHPDKHSSRQTARVTRLFQTVQTFFVECCHVMANEGMNHTSNSSLYSTSSSRSSSNQSTTSRKNRRTHSPNSVVDETDNDNTNTIPLEFDAMAKWPMLQQVACQREAPFQSVSTTQLLYHVGYACLNYRGALTHGQPIDCTYQVAANLQDNHSITSCLDVWAEAGFAPAECRHLHHASVEDIQSEIYRHGPVLSTSFVLEQAYYNHCRQAGNFSERHVGGVHPILLVGWTLGPQGRVWLAQALRGPTFSVGMHQFGVEHDIWAPPMHLLQQKSWQSPGPYWDVCGLYDKCPAWQEYFGGDYSTSSSSSDEQESTTTATARFTTKLSLLEVMPLSSSDIEALCDLWTDGVGFHTIINERRTFVLRDQFRQAQSRRVILREVARVQYGNNNSKRVWKVTLSVVRK